MKITLIILMACWTATAQVYVGIYDSERRLVSENKLPHHLSGGLNRNTIQGNLVFTDNSCLLPYKLDQLGEMVEESSVAGAALCLETGLKTVCYLDDKADDCKGHFISRTLYWCGNLCWWSALGIAITTAPVTFPVGALAGCGEFLCTRGKECRGTLKRHLAVQVEDKKLICTDESNMIPMNGESMTFLIDLDKERGATGQLTKLMVKLSAYSKYQGIQWSYKPITIPSTNEYTPLRPGVHDFSGLGFHAFELRAQFRKKSIMNALQGRNAPSLFKVDYDFSTAVPESPFVFASSTDSVGDHQQEQETGYLHPDLIKDSTFLQPLFSDRWGEEHTSSQPWKTDQPYWHAFLSLCYRHLDSAVIEAQAFTEEQWKIFAALVQWHGPDVMTKTAPVFNAYPIGKAVWAVMQN